MFSGWKSTVIGLSTHAFSFHSDCHSGLTLQSFVHQEEYDAEVAAYLIQIIKLNVCIKIMNYIHHALFVKLDKMGI